MTTKIEERVGIPATQEVVWELLADLEAWKDWNPLHPRVDGKLSIGAPIRLEQRLEGRPAETLDGVVADWVPYEQIHISRSLARGWAKSVRYMEIEPLGPDSCVFSVGELFGGFLGDSIAKKQRRALRAGFTAMAEALRDRAVKAAGGEAVEGSSEVEPAKVESANVEAGEPTAATPGARKTKASPLKPMTLNQYAPKPLGMKPPGGMGGMKPPGTA